MEHICMGLMLAIFLLGYALIVFEPVAKVDKTGVSILMAVGCWALFFLNPANTHEMDIAYLKNQFEYVCEVSTFVLAVMVLVEIVQAHDGFSILTEPLRPTSKRAFLWTVGFLTFFFSTMIANVVATLVMLAVSAKFLKNKEDRMIVGAGIVIASNAGGAWTPIGDVTTTMLWIAGRITTVPVMKDLFLPSLISMAVTFLFLTFMIKGPIEAVASQGDVKKKEKEEKLYPHRFLVFFIGGLSLAIIPALNYFLDFPPYLGALLGMGLLWIAIDMLYPERQELKVPALLGRVDLSMYFFFVGILLSVQALDSAGMLHSLESFVAKSGLSDTWVALSLGLLSALVDNVPLVAASLGMYQVAQYPVDCAFWQLVAYAAGVGGSALIIGSPAGIAYMNVEKVSFWWFMKKISLAVLVGFFAGAFFYLM